MMWREKQSQILLEYLESNVFKKNPVEHIWKLQSNKNQMSSQVMAYASV